MLRWDSFYIRKGETAVKLAAGMDMIKHIREFFSKSVNKQLDGVGVIEVILILVILIGLVLIFKDQITEIIGKAFEAITGDAGGIIPE